VSTSIRDSSEVLKEEVSVRRGEVGLELGTGDEVVKRL